MFIWRLAHNSLPVKRNLARRGIKTDTTCPVCHRLDEDCGHLFFKCKKAKQCWQAMALEHIRAELEQKKTGKDTVARILSLQQQEWTKVIIWLWRWWSERNKINGGEKMDSIAEINSSVSFYLMETDNLAGKGKDTPANSDAKWTPPPPDCCKINVDASFHAILNQGGWGFVVRDWNGKFLAGGAGKIPCAASAVQAEATGMQKSLMCIADLGMNKIIVETDSVIVAKAITSTEYDRSPYGSLFRQIREVMRSKFFQISIKVCPRK